ncbi:MAG: hypothetical protein QNJ71_05075 [Acidimicrobiia bacterium]|nr:hypothetical protein [Acidimicrobiia bacterium]
MSTGARLIYISYNVIWWMPVALVVIGVWSYREGAIAYLVVTALRALINLYRNNMLTTRAAQSFPLRAP